MDTTDTVSTLFALLQVLVLVVVIAGGSVALGALGRYLLGRLAPAPELPGPEADFRPRPVDGGAARTPAEALERGSVTAIRALQPDALVPMARLHVEASALPRRAEPGDVRDAAPATVASPAAQASRASRSARRCTEAQDLQGRHASATWA